MALERGEHDTAFVRFVTVLEQELGHVASVRRRRVRDIGRDPDLHPEFLATGGRAYPRGERRWAIALATEQLVGRHEELEVLDGATAALERGDFGAIEIVGEPGIGKTRLLAELAARAEARGFLVLSGCASESERDVPFAVFVDALDEYVAGLEAHRLTSLDEDIRAELDVVLPSLRAGRPKDGRSREPERYRTYRAVRELLELLARPKPLALLIDDLHWADPASAELVGTLLRRPPAAPVLVALALRPRQLPGRLTAELARAHRAGSLTSIGLGPLSRTEAHALLDGATAGADAERLYSESGGNPFYLQQLARSTSQLVRDTQDVPLSASGADVPPLVAAALSEELALLSETARRVLEGAAVVGEPFEPELAAAAAKTSEDDAIDALDMLLRLDLVRTTEVPRRYRFRHPLLRRAVYESTPGGWRLRAHERSAEALEARGASALSRAYHVERFARLGDEAAVAILCEAGTATMHQAPESASRWFAAALRLMPEGAPAEERGELLLARARSLTATGFFAESRSVLLECIALAPPGAAELRLRLTIACAGVEHLLGHHDDAHRRLISALREVGDARSPDAVALMLELAVDGFYRMDFDAMSQWAERAVDAALPLNDDLLTAAAVASLAYASALDRTATEAAEHCAEAAIRVDALTDSDLTRRLDACVNLAAAELNLGRLDDAVVHAERAIAIARATGQADHVPVLVYSLGWNRRLRGELTLAADLLDGAVESARLSGNTQSLAGNLLSRSMAALAAGDLELALGTAEESVELARGLDGGFVSASAGLALAAALLESGDASRAVDVLVRPSGGAELPSVPRGWRANWLELLTRCQLAAGRLDDARRCAELAQASAAACGLRLSGALADRATAAVALSSADAASAAELALASASVAEEVGARIDAALSRALAGRALARAGRTKEAVAELRRAGEQFDDCGALGYRAAVEQELRSLGQHVHRRSARGKRDQSGVASLTGRELEIARLIAELRTNPEIAATLFLSPKTVESHIRNIFHKLGVTSRVQVARAVERADVLSAGAGSPPVRAG